MTNLFTFSYWFNLNPGSWLESSLKIVYTFFGLCVVIGLVALLFVYKNNKDKIMQKFWRKVQRAGLTIGFIGLFLVFARQQRIYFLAMPFLLVLLLIGAGFWGYFIVNYKVKIIPEKKKYIEKKEQQKKYLP